MYVPRIHIRNRLVYELTDVSSPVHRMANSCETATVVRPALLTTDELETALVDRPEWAVDGHAIRRAFRFADFVEAFGFMASAALVAERMDHHPDWSNVYNRVEVRLSTHDVGGVTALDLEWAAAADRLFGDRSTTGGD